MVNSKPLTAMKKITKIFACIFAFAAVSASCSKVVELENEGVVNSSEESITLLINANSSQTKTVFQDIDGSDYPVKWSATGEVISLAEVYTPAEGDAVVAAATSTDYSLSNSNSTASFNVNLAAKVLAGTYDYHVIYPSTSYVDVVPSYSDVSVVIPGIQTPTPTSPDPAATLLYASVKGLTEQPTSALDLDFSHISAYGKMTIKNAGSAIGGGETIESVSVSVPAGGFYYYWSNGNTVSVNATKTSEVVVKTDNLDTSSDFVAWFACKPYSLAIGDILTVKITTDAKTYVRPIVLTKALAFTSGKVSKFSVDMASAAPLIYSTAFNYSIVGSTYTNADPIEGADAGGTKWYITYGNWNGSNCAQLRVYNAGNFGKIYNGFDCSNVTAVFYDAKVSNAALKLNTYYSTDSGANWTKVDDAISLTTDLKRYGFTVSATGVYPKVRIMFEVAGTKPSSSNYALTIDNVEIYGKGGVLAAPSITADNITNIPAIGVTDESSTYTIHNFTGADDIVATCDNTVVTDASVDNSGTITFTVAPNYSTSSRSTGTITLTSANESINKVITVSQQGETFSASAETVTIDKDASSATFTITTPSFGWATTVNQADGKNLTLSLPTSGSGNASAQTLTVNSTTAATASEQTLGTIVVYRNGNTSDPQKKTITIKKASTALASTYTKVTSISSGTYLICNASAAKVISGVGDYLTTASVTISGGTTITGNDTLDDCEFTITALTGGDAGKYSIEFNSQYVLWNTSTKVKLGDDLTAKGKWTISIDGSGLAKIQTDDTTANKYRYWGWYGSSSQYRPYQTDGSSYSNTPLPTLFKKD